MSFFMVPSVSYQTQQKLNKQNLNNHNDKEKQTHKHKHKDNDKLKDKLEKDKGRKLKSKSSSVSSLFKSSSSSKSISSNESKSINSNPNTTISEYEELSDTSQLPNSNETNGENTNSQSDEQHQRVITDKNKSQTGELDQRMIKDVKNLSLDKATPDNSEDSSQAQYYPAKEFASQIASNYRETMAVDNFKALDSLKSLSNASLNSMGQVSPSLIPSGASSTSLSSMRPRANSSFSSPSQQTPSTTTNSQYLQNQAFFRNTSMASSSSASSSSSFHNLVSHSGNQKFRKLSFLGSSAANKRKGSLSGLSPESPGAFSMKRADSSMGQTSYFPDTSIKGMSPLPTKPSPSSPLASFSPGKYQPFVPILDLSIYNSFEGLRSNFYTPSYQIFRYNNFLSLLSDYHSSDAINFSNIRNHSLFKFIIRQKSAKAHLESDPEMQNMTNLSTMESIVSYKLYAPVRALLREIIRSASNNPKLLNHEELVQTNFVNYMRYLINLPEGVDVNGLDEVGKRHYEFKKLFKSIVDTTYALKSEEATGMVHNESDVLQVRTKMLIEVVTKVSYEYILLEKYRFDIYSKLHGNRLFDKDILTYLFDQYKNNIKNHSRENVKVFIFNASNSIQYGWYLAITMPFIRFVESHIYTENSELIENYHQYQASQLNSSVKKDFKSGDNELYDTYIKKLNFSSFTEYTNMSNEKLVKLARSIDNQSPKYTKVNRHEVSDPSTTYSHRAMNYEYSNYSMSSISSNTFELIHCSDLPYQVNCRNYKTILTEFHRILKPKGCAILEFIQFGSKTVNDFLTSQDGHFPRAWNYKELSLLENIEAIPNFMETILLALQEIFGEGNVKFSVTLLNSALDVHNFILKFGGMKLYELIGKFNDYCEFFHDSNEGFKSVNGASVHFSIQLRAYKGENDTN